MRTRVNAPRRIERPRTPAPQRLLRAVDGFQRRRRFAAIPFAAFKKFGDDDGGRLAGLIAYYGFFSVFPLLLVLVSILGFVLDGDPSLRQSIVDSALAQFPVIGHELQSGSGVSDGLYGSWVTIVVGGATALWAGLGVAHAAQVAMNTVWEVPRAQWPSFVARQVRALGVLALLGIIVVASTFVSGYGTSGRAAIGPPYLGPVIGLALNLLLFELAFRILTAERLAWRTVLPGATLAAVLWTALQAAGGYFVTQRLQSSSDVYGTFALVLVLLVWIALGAQVTLLCAEVNVVVHRRLWPRSLVQPPLSEGDERVYAAIVQRARMRPELAVRTWFTANQDRGARGRDGAGGDPGVPVEQQAPDPLGV
jgi:YihY family inner membrane protein